MSNIRTLSTSICQHRQASYAQWASGLAHLPDLESLARTAEEAVNLSVLEAVRHQMDVTATAVQRIVVSAQNAEQAEMARQELEQRHAEALARLAFFERALAETDPRLAAKFDPSGARQVQAMVIRIKAAIGEARFDEAIESAEAGVTLSNHHREQVLQAEREWLERRQAARATLHEMEALLSSALGDRIVTAWRKSAVETLSDTLAGAVHAIDYETWDVAAAIMDEVRAALARVTTEAVKREEEEAQRRYIARSVIAVLNEQGFYTEVPQLLSDDRNSDVIIQAVRSDQRSLQIGIQRQGRVRYEVDGASRVLTPTPGSKVIQECPDAETAILALHKQLETDFGINMDDLTWEGKPFDMSSKAIPDAGGRSANAGGGRAI